ncbi:hypothetical protein [Methanobrevibacter sp.]|uniref:hypothetical protein n=1 Tax=Methanobrevibacter sp. TaxID=66852 RepID=UPI0025F635B8|nr:hypothetical protein [Methanobrevibacter sp.]MBQ2832385.1 hypothetical protein [Methanobrevibacter sp.]
MTKQFTSHIDEVDDTIIDISYNGKDIAWFLSDDITKKQIENIVNLLNNQQDEIKELKESDLIFFQAVWDILMKYQHLFNREMADEVLDVLGIELPRWFE